MNRRRRHGAQLWDWDGEYTTTRSRFAAPLDIWGYIPADTPTVDTKARAAGRARAAVIRAGVRRYLDRMGR